MLVWHLKKKIILDIAKGLAYLHEECRRKIIHLNTKPQNILLDGNFNAKIPGSGLSKLVDKDQSKIVNYHARRSWLSSSRMVELSNQRKSWHFIALELLSWNYYVGG